MNKIKKCFYCGNDILQDDGKIVPLERPYVNLWAHKGCSNAMDIEYLEENYQRILDYVKASDIMPISKKTKRK